eukprot:8175663-Pyramimonas_sp.AAC.1
MPTAFLVGVESKDPKERALNKGFGMDESLFELSQVRKFYSGSNRLPNVWCKSCNAQCIHADITFIDLPAAVNDFQLAHHSISLAETAGLRVVGASYQRMDRVNPKTYIGSGKVEEIARAVKELGIDTVNHLLCGQYFCMANNTVIFDDELSPTQGLLRTIYDRLNLTRAGVTPKRSSLTHYVRSIAGKSENFYRAPIGIPVRPPFREGELAGFRWRAIRRRSDGWRVTHGDLTVVTSPAEI